MHDAILPLRRCVVASRLSRPARSFFSTPSFLKTRSAKANTGERRRMPVGWPHRPRAEAPIFPVDLWASHLLSVARHAAGRNATSEGPGSAYQPDYHTGGDADLSSPRRPASLSCFFRQVAGRLDALKYREQGFGLRSLITCVKSHMQGDQMTGRSIHRNVKRLSFPRRGPRNA